MIISDKLLRELADLNENIEMIIDNKKVLNEIQMESFLRKLEKHRYNILSEIKLYNKTIEYKRDRIANISDDYKAEFTDNILKLYIPEPMPSYKNLKTHAYKNILLNLTEIEKPYANIFSNQIFIFIKIFDNIKGWDIDNKFIKPIPDSLILSGVIQDDNIDKMFYCVKGEFSENPHTEIYITEAKNVSKILQIS
ncbi:MAG: hypothetical protein J6I85_02755 [Clostridia bacterium]|nr:hypothetical protein [Clostridia bacterium]MBP3800941.1 hypothetical protein [Clostridia bacterium]